MSGEKYWQKTIVVQVTE